MLKALVLLLAVTPLTLANVVINFSGALVGSPMCCGTFTGQLAYAYPQAGTTTAFYGGTQTVFTFSSLYVTIGAQTISEMPGNLALYNDVVPPNGVPVGDSFYTFVPGIPNNAPGHSTGTAGGITPNYVYLGFVSNSGKAFSGTALPRTIDLGAFSEAFLGVNYGPLGAGNTTFIVPITSLTASTPGEVVPEPVTPALCAASLALLATCLSHKLRR